MGRGWAAPSLVVLTPYGCLVCTVAVTSRGAALSNVGSPLMVVMTGVMVLGMPDSSTVTQASVGLAACRTAILSGAGTADAAPRSKSHAAGRASLEVNMMLGLFGRAVEVKAPSLRSKAAP